MPECAGESSKNLILPTQMLFDVCVCLFGSQWSNANNTWPVRMEMSSSHLLS